MENTKIINQSNKGPASATQRGIDFSKGDYINLGGDDVMSENCTKILLEVIKNNNSVAVFSRYKLIKYLNKLNLMIKFQLILRF